MIMNSSKSQRLFKLIKKGYKMKTKTILSVISLFTLFSLSASYAGMVLVKPGKFDHFTLLVPERIVAGESFVIRARVYDSNNNLIMNFSELGKEFKLAVTGSANAQPSHLGLTSFPGGVTNITVTDKKAETILFSIYEVGGTVPVISKELVISPNKLDHFLLYAPATATAGNSFDARIIAKDIYDNTVSDREMLDKNVKITSSGTSSLKVIGAFSPDFKNGAASINLVAEKIGNAALEAQEVLTGSKGRSQYIIVNPAVLSYFKLYSPKEAVAGEPFEITVTAYDPYGNPVNYASSGYGVVLQSTGNSRIEPSFIKPLEFRNNEAVVKVVYEKAEEINIIAKEHNKDQEWKSNLIKINPAATDHFVVVTPDDAISAQPFKIKIEPYDSYENLVRDYNLTGSSVVLRTTGTGVLAPSIISPAEFIDGIALVEVVYDKAESFTISAEMAPAKAAERITIKERKFKKAAEPIKPPLKPPVVEKKLERIEKPKAEKEAAEIKESAAVKKIKREKLKKEEHKKKTRHPFNISNISIVEAKEKAFLVIKLTSSDEKLEYKDEIESRSGKEWLKIRLKPAVRNTEKPWKFKSEFIGEVYVEEDKSEQDILNIYVEFIPQKIIYDIARFENSLIVTTTKP
jgi:hypothetical protein